jgi:hypothetical protein
MTYDFRFDPKTNTGSITPTRSFGAAFVILLIPGLFIFENALELLGCYVSSLAHVFDARIVVERHAWMSDQSAVEDASRRLCVLGVIALAFIVLGGLRLRRAYRGTRVLRYRHIRSSEMVDDAGDPAPPVTIPAGDRRSAPT